MPVYLVVERSGLYKIWPLIAVATVGVLAGTVFGMRALRQVPERGFRRLVALLLLGLGAWILFGAGE